MRRLVLSSTNKKLSGVCGGIGKYLEVDPTLVRLVWLVVTILSGIIPGLIAYILAAIIMPSEHEVARKEEGAHHDLKT